MSFYSSYHSPLGAFAGGGREIFGPFSFTESWSSDDFENAAEFNRAVKPYLDQVNRKDLSYSPLSTTVITAASAAWNSWKQASDLGDPTSAAFMANITGQMSDLIGRGDALSLNAAVTGVRSEATEVSRYDVFNQIQTLVKQVAASKAKAAAALAAVTAAANYIPPPEAASAGTIPTGSSLVNNPQQNPIPPGGFNQSGDTAVTSDNTMLYVGIGVAVVALIGGVFLLKHKKSASAPATAGYRRRRARR